MKLPDQLPPKQQADLDAYSYYIELDDYINEHNGRFFFGGSDAAGACFFSELDKLLPHLKKIRKRGVIYYRARIVEGPTRRYEWQTGQFEAYSAEELAAPPAKYAKEGRINPKGVSYLYLADSRYCALTEVRPAISSVVAIAKGKLHRNVSIASFISPRWKGIGLFEKSMVEMVGRLFSEPTNSQDSSEYIPSQAVAEYIKNKGFDGIEYRSSQDMEGVNLALFDNSLWTAEETKIFEVENIVYKAARPRVMVEALGYEEEEL